LRQRRLGGGGASPDGRACITATNVHICSNDTRSQKETPCGSVVMEKSGCTSERLTKSLMVVILRVA
jgi:hypothetical protein